MKTLLVSVLAVASTATFASGAWIHFRAPLGKYAVDLPAQPSHRTDAFRLQESVVTMYIYDSKAAGGRVISTYGKLPPAIAFDKSMGVPEAYIENALRRMHAKETSRMTITLAGKSSYDIEFMMGKIHGELFVMTTGNRMFGLFLTANSKAEIAGLRKHVVSSFRLG